MSASSATTQAHGRRPLAVVRAVAIGALLGLLSWYLVIGPVLGAEAATPAAEAAVPPRPADADDAVDVAADVEDEPLVVTYEVLLERDPFDPVVPRPEPAHDPAALVTTDDTIGDGDPDGLAEDGTAGDQGAYDPLPVSDVPAPEDGSVLPPAPAPCESDGRVAVCAGQTVSLVRISVLDGRRVAIVQLDATIFELEKGQAFGSFWLRSVGEDRVTILHGDEELELLVGDGSLK